MRDEKEGRKKQALSNKKQGKYIHVHEDCVRISPGWEATLAIGVVRTECESGLLSLLHGQTTVIPTCVRVCVWRRLSGFMLLKHTHARICMYVYVNVHDHSVIVALYNQNVAVILLLCNNHLRMSLLHCVNVHDVYMYYEARKIHTTKCTMYYVHVHIQLESKQKAMFYSYSPLMTCPTPTWNEKVLPES